MKIYDNVKVFQSLKPAVYTTDSAGQSFVDTLGYHDGMLAVSSGAITGTGSDIYTVTVFEGDATASMAAVSGFALTITGTETNTTKMLRIADLNVTRKRYLQARLTCSATTISVAAAANFVLGMKDSNPVNS